MDLGAQIFEIRYRRLGGGNEVIVKKIEKKNPDTGEMEVTFALSEPQVHLLMEFAINMLVGKGLVTFDNENEEKVGQMEMFNFPPDTPDRGLKN